MTIFSAEQLAYLAKLVNEGNTFEGYQFTLYNNLDLSKYAWEPIGNMQHHFCGQFRGGYSSSAVVKGLYTEGYEIAGLFGYVAKGNSTAQSEYPLISHIQVAESYISGTYLVGGITGYTSARVENCSNYHTTVIGNESAYATGGIAGRNGDMFFETGPVINCKNSGKVTGSSRVGGIVGYVGSGTVRNCMNFNSVSGSNNVGGISGYNVGTATISNSANFGSVNGNINIGGISGENDVDDGRIYNCYSIGKVTGGVDYVGAVCGRNTGNDGEVHQCYYLVGSATGNGSPRNAAGKKGGSIGDSTEGTKTASFTSATSNLSINCEEGAENSNLITALNHWATRCATNHSALQWIVGEDGYPVIEGVASL